MVLARISMQFPTIWQNESVHVVCWTNPILPLATHSEATDKLSNGCLVSCNFLAVALPLMACFFNWWIQADYCAMFGADGQDDQLRRLPSFEMFKHSLILTSDLYFSLCSGAHMFSIGRTCR